MSEDIFNGIDFSKVNPHELENLHKQEVWNEDYPPSNGATVLYHGNCADGFGAAWAFYKTAACNYTEVSYVEGFYGKQPAIRLPRYRNTDDLYILDFSLSKEELIYLSHYFRKIVLIDHHKTAEESLSHAHEWKPDNLFIHFDMNYSGAAFTWMILNPEGDPVPKLLQYIQDRDLWKFELPFSKEINARIALEEKTFIGYDVLAETLEIGLLSTTEAGASLLKYQQKIAAEIAADARPMTIQTATETYHGKVSNCSPQFASDVGNILAKDTGTFGATYHTDKNGDTKFSLRSSGDYDVSKIAKRFGGGGHKNAAGFSFSASALDKELVIFDMSVAESRNALRNDGT